MKWPFGRDREAEVRPLTERLQALVDESDEPLVVVGSDSRIVATNEPGEAILQPPEAERESYDELRAGFTAAVSHELRTPLARILALLETAALPGQDPVELAEQARKEVAEITEIVDEVLFLSELETGRAIVALGSTRAFPIVEEVFERLREPSDRAAVLLRVDGDPEAELPIRPRMLRVVVDNLAQNAIRYAGPGATLTVSVAENELVASDDGAGVNAEDLPRLFERFFRADRVRGSRGTGLGLAVVKHIVVAAGGTVEASGAPGTGLTIRCAFSAGRAG
jgi:two-component system, OmpR family, phosphate regulon sensor histidine kinase PhoR